MYEFSYPFSDLTPKFYTPFQTFQTKKAKTIPYFRLKRLENHTLKCDTYIYRVIYGSTPLPLRGFTPHQPVHNRRSPLVGGKVSSLPWGCGRMRPSKQNTNRFLTDQYSVNNGKISPTDWPIRIARFSDKSTNVQS